jgi:predicted DNA binding protein
MRRLVLEVDGDDATKLVGEPTLENIESVEAVSLLKEDPNDFAGVFKIKFKSPSAHLSDFPMRKGEQVQLLESGTDGSYVFYYRGAPQTGKRLGGSLPSGGFLSMPFEIREGKLVLTYLGTNKEVRSVLEFLRKSGVQFGVRSLLDARFSATSPLSKLTDKQRKVILTAFSLGYYDIPRRVGSNELAARLGIGNPTFVMHRRKAEKTLLSNLIEPR